MTQFSKSSLNKSSATTCDSNNKKNVRPMLLGVGAIVAILGLINIFSTSSSDSIATNNASSSLKGSNSNPLDQPSTAEEKKQEEQFDIDYGKLALEKNIFNEDPETLGLPDANNMFPKEYHFNPKRAIYHHYKRGLSGSVIEDILMCHALAFHLNVTYGGSCGETHDEQVIHETLLDSLGLKDQLPFGCPRDKPRDSKPKDVRASVVPLSKCREYNTRIWTPEYLHYLRTLVTLPEKKDKDTFTIAVHIRRDKVTPCAKQFKGYYRYLPNSHYMALIDKYTKPGVTTKVHIYSQPKSFEPLDEFTAKGYEVSYDDELKDIWHSFVTADVVIMSRSDFSMIPGLVAKGTVVYTPFWHPPMKGWVVVDNALMEQTDAELERLRGTCKK